MPLVWSKPLNHFVNSVAISNDGQLVAAGTYFYPYGVKPGHPPLPSVTDGTFGTYAFDASGNELWRREFVGNEGIYSVAVSGNGQVVAAGGLRSGGQRSSDPSTPTKCTVRAYDANGSGLLKFQALHTRVNSVSLDHQGKVLAAGLMAGQLLVFRRGTGDFLPTPDTAVSGAGPRIDMVAVHPSGEYLIAAAWKSKFYLVTLNKGAVDKVFTWTAQGPKLELLACALASDNGVDRFVVAGHNKVFLLTKSSMMAPGGPQYVDVYETPSGGTYRDIRWLAMSGDGSLVTVVQNLGDDQNGTLLTLSCDGNSLTELRPPATLRFNPNSTSISADGALITAADGHPVKAPGTFYIIRASDGAVLMQHPTDDMNWPMVISKDGTAAAAGSDLFTGDNLFYFTP
jgi:WD40 repeat protein